MSARPKKRRAERQVEEAERQKNLKRLQVMGEQPDEERRLEELLFGGEEALLERLQPTQRKDRDQTLLDESSSDSEVENEARSDFPPRKRAAWVDEEDGADDDVEMTHRFRKNLVKSSTEKTLTMRKLQQRLKEQFQTAMGGTPSWAERKVKNKRKDKEDSAEESDDDDDLLRKTGNFVSASSVLPKDILQPLNYRRLGRKTSKQISVI
ncbi:U3 small nucleolar RNA-associated protein 18 homolog [Hemitrygon akajei]|uniref:U3 small nucleolar RNA-associated protein 18 homolog n=1 Tax=Hemitrygon akajei TaxID=2704970 RepID=UPI003BF97493